MTVYSMPSTEDLAALDRRTVRGRWKMLLVLLICAAPVVASYFAFYVWRPDARRNYGELIQPQRPLPDLVAQPLSGESGNLRQLKDQWLLISVAGSGCPEECRKHLYLQRQLREVLGKDKDRIDWVWLVTDAGPMASDLQAVTQVATVLRVDPVRLSQWLEPASGHQLSEHLYVVDPMGNWMMRFPAGLDLSGAAKAKRDLERLMRASASWDLPGRP